MASWKAIAIQQLNARAPELKAHLIEKGELKAFLEEKASEAETFHQQILRSLEKRNSGNEGLAAMQAREIVIANHLNPETW
ncbi:hypothetical protein [Candidatus Palauibacter sp.]|uniref:hypothetical protein n=1 Tax=Candidatus Palauibacter sp. TaxID=3101350 RepID=UPI003AF1F4CE